MDPNRRRVQKILSPDDLEAAKEVADKVVENAICFVASRIHKRPPPFEDHDSPYMQMLLTQHVKVQTSYLSSVKWSDGLDVTVTQNGDLDVNAKIAFDQIHADPNLNVTVHQG